MYNKRAILSYKKYYVKIDVNNVENFLDLLIENKNNKVSIKKV